MNVSCIAFIVFTALVAIKVCHKFSRASLIDITRSPIVKPQSSCETHAREYVRPALLPLAASCIEQYDDTSYCHSSRELVLLARLERHSPSQTCYCNAEQLSMLMERGVLDVINSQLMRDIITQAAGQP